MAQVEEKPNEPSFLDKMKDKLANFSHRFSSEGVSRDQQAVPLFDMGNMIPTMRNTFSELFDKPSQAHDHAHKLIALSMLQDCKGIIFLSMDKAAFGVGSTYGVGCLMIRQENVVLRVQNDNPEQHQQVKQQEVITGSGWSAPLAIRLDSFDVGLQVGVAKSHHIIAVRSLKFLQDLFSLGKVSVGINGLTIVDAHKSFSGDNPKLLNKEGLAADLIDFSVTEGTFLGDTLKNQTLTVDFLVNASYYGRQLTSSQVLMAEPKGIMPQQHLDEWRTLVDTLHQAADKNSYSIGKECCS